MAVSEPGSKQELMRRFLEPAHDLSDPNHSHGSLSMHRVCNEIGLTPNDGRCQMIMSAHFRTGTWPRPQATERLNPASLG